MLVSITVGLVGSGIVALSLECLGLALTLFGLAALAARGVVS